MALLLGVAISGSLAARNKSYQPIVIEPSVAELKVRPSARGGQESPFQEFTLNDILAGDDAPEAIEISGYAPGVNPLASADMSPRARREMHRRVSGTAFQESGREPAKLDQLNPAVIIWQSFAQSRGDGQQRIEPQAVQTGSDVAQLGHFEDETAALLKWSMLLQRHSDLLTSVDWYLEPASSGGLPITRLRVAGFGAREIALWFCDELVSRNETCVPTVVR